MMMQTMIRTVNHRERWYRLEVSKNLFDEWVLTRSFGSLYHASPIGTMIETFPDKLSAYAAYERLNKQKIQKGYISISDIMDKL